MGSEKTVVLLHGFGEDHSVFSRQVEVLQKYFRVYTPDLPGSGKNFDHVWQSGTESIDWMAEWMYEQLSRKGISSCIMLGHSMGGYITLAFAEKYPEILQGFGLIHSTAFADSPQKKENREKAILFMEEKGGYAFLKTAIPGLFRPEFSQVFPDVIQELISKAGRFRTESLIAYYRAMINRQDRSKVLKEAAVPVLLVAGSHDTAVPPDDLIKQASLSSICHFHLLKDSGHMSMVESPEVLCRILFNFIISIL